MIIAGGRNGHLPGMVAGHTIVPIIGVPIKSRRLHSLLSIVQMGGVPVATMAIGGLAPPTPACSPCNVARHDAALAEALTAFRAERAAQVRSIELER